MSFWAFRKVKHEAASWGGHEKPQVFFLSTKQTDRNQISEILHRTCKDWNAITQL